MSRKILFSLITIGLVVGLVGAGAFAQFNDTETSTGNTFTAGTLDVKVGGLDDGDTVYALDIGPMAPGDAVAGYTWVVTNSGNVAGDLKLTVSAITDSPGTTPEPENTTDNGELSGQLVVILFEDADSSGDFTSGDTELYGDGFGGMALLSGMPGDYDASNPGTEGEDPVNIRLNYQLPDREDNNDVMDDSSSFDITFSLES